jgi:hypothetical protein
MNQAELKAFEIMCRRFEKYSEESKGKLGFYGPCLYCCRFWPGTARLERYHEDGNKWIDEQDSVFNDLRIWSRDGNGTDHLLSLSQSRVGGIYVGSAATPFSLTDANNNQLG